MANLREIKRRIGAVGNIKQITRAMHMVAAAKLQQAEAQVRSARPYATKLREVLGALTRETGVVHPLMEEREVEHTLVVSMAGDRGLAGPYNSRVTQYTEELLAAVTGPRLFAVGRVLRDYFLRRMDVYDEMINLGEDAEYSDAEEAAERATDAFLSGEVDRVMLVYTEYRSAVSQAVVHQQLLPVSPAVLTGGTADEGDEPDEESGQAAGDGDAAETVEYIYEPSSSYIFSELLPKFVNNQVYQAMMEAKASEHGSRMTAMKNATDNAEELIEELTLDFNRARQNEITTEISEIVSGAAAIDEA